MPVQLARAEHFHGFLHIAISSTLLTQNTELNMQTRCVHNVRTQAAGCCYQLPSCCAANLYLFGERLDGRETGDAAARWRVRARAAGAAGREARRPDTSVNASAPSGHCDAAERWLRSHAVKRFFRSHDCCHYVRLLSFLSSDTNEMLPTSHFIYIPRGVISLRMCTRTIPVRSAHCACV